MDEILALKILDSREIRSCKQKKLIDKYNSTLISYTLNIPGIKKDSNIYRDIHKIGFIKILSKLNNKNIKILYSNRIDKTTGSEGYIVVAGEAKKIKKYMVDIENSSEIGRIFDIDIIDRNHNVISRDTIGVELRKCIICDKEVRLCMREQNHTYEELLEKINEIYLNYKKR